ncbi:MAG: GNAT family N-acetyltransferase [Bacilli bacterium]|nr:GNAT family N-acetyltransferase [Bacilli bacterium]
MYKIEKVNEYNVKDYMYVNFKSWKESYVGIVNQDFLDKLDNNIDEKIQNQINIIKQEKELNQRYILYVDDKPLGMVRYGKSRQEEYQNDGELCAIYLLNDVKKKGYGKILFNFAVDNLKKEGYKKMIIGCLKGNPTNDFYKYMGAKEVFRKNLTIGEDEYEEIFYLLEI